MRTPLVLLSSFVALALGAAAAGAQEERPSAVSSTAAAPSMPMDCSAGAMKRHDHGAERNAPSAKSMPCAPAESSSGANAKAIAKTKPVHDHGKFHKNQ